MNVATITVKCCEHEEAKMQMNREGRLHYRCVYCGFELNAGMPPPWEAEDNFGTSTMDES